MYIQHATSRALDRDDGSVQANRSRYSRISMLTGEIRGQIDRIWDSFWTGGISNPLEVIEQITYLLFLKRLDEIQEVEERKALQFKKPLERRIFPAGKDPKNGRTKISAGRASGTSTRETCMTWSRSTCFRFCGHWAAMNPRTRTT